MNFEEIIRENDSKYDVYVGYDGRKNKKIINIKDTPSTIITGETGSGKSMLLDQILCQLVKNNTSLELELALVDTGGVELNYYADTRYVRFSALGSKDEGLRVINKVVQEMDYRRKLVNDHGYVTVDEYNRKEENKIPNLVLAIDDNDSLLDEEDIDTSLLSIIRGLEETNIFLFLATSNPYNKFFSRNKNTYASNLISLDLADSEQSALANVSDAEALPTGKFIMNDKEYYMFNFDDSIIFDILNK